MKTIDIDYNIHYKEDRKYKLYSNYLHVGLGWDFDKNNTYDLDSSILVFDNNINVLTKVNFQQLTTYNGTINLNGDDLTGEGDGDDEEIRIFLDKLPSKVQIFTVQINSYRKNSLKYVKSAYIRLSTDTEVIGTYSINEAGNNIGLIIGCFSKSNSDNSDKWYFRPLNKAIPGHIVTESIGSIKEILHSIFDLKIEGIDVSVYQGTINWPAVAQTKYFAILKAGSVKINPDAKFEENYVNAKKAGVKLGAYWYSYAQSVEDAKNEAAYFLSLLKDKQFEWPVYYDIEEVSQFSSGINNIIAKEFCKIVESKKYYCGIYSHRDRWNKSFDDEVKTNYTVWIADHDKKKPLYTGHYNVWQKSKTGNVNGISGYVDLDESNIDFEPIMKQNHLNGY